MISNILIKIQRRAAGLGKKKPKPSLFLNIKWSQKAFCEYSISESINTKQMQTWIFFLNVNRLMHVYIEERRPLLMKKKPTERKKSLVLNIKKNIRMKIAWVYIFISHGILMKTSKMKLTKHIERETEKMVDLPYIFFPLCRSFVLWYRKISKSEY